MQQYFDTISLYQGTHAYLYTTEISILQSTETVTNMRGGIYVITKALQAKVEQMCILVLLTAIFRVQRKHVPQ